MPRAKQLQFLGQICTNNIYTILPLVWANLSHELQLFSPVIICFFFLTDMPREKQLQFMGQILPEYKARRLTHSGGRHQVFFFLIPHTYNDPTSQVQILCGYE